VLTFDRTVARLIICDAHPATLSGPPCASEEELGE
jgi:hypothetical protein